MLNFVACDDNLDFLESVCLAIDEFMADYTSLQYHIDKFDDYDLPFKRHVVENQNREIYILDYDMPTENGIDMANFIRNLDKKSVIIILTAHHEVAADIYKARLNVLTFISKDKQYAKLLKLAFAEVLDYFKDAEDVLSFTDSGNSFSIPLKSILYIGKNGRKTVVKTDRGEFESYMSLEKMKELLPKSFKQTHRACIVNMKRVCRINYGKRIIHFDNGLQIDYLSDKYKEELAEC